MADLFFKHGGYRNLRSFQTATLIYDLTVWFCDHFVEKTSRTKDQMVQAARSGRQNIAEGSQAAGTSRETELKLVNVARASLEELLLDYEDYLRQHRLPLWRKDSPEALRLRARRATSLTDLSDLTDRSDPAVLANTAICLVHQANWLLDRQLAAIGQQFAKEGGFRERLSRVRRGTMICLICLIGLIGLICRPQPALATNSGNLTMSLWVNPTTSVASKALISKAEEFRVFTNASGYPGCQIKTTTWQTAVVSSSQLVVGSWAQVICTYDLVNLKVYVNGVLKGTQALTTLPDDTAAVLRIGQDDSASTTYTNLAGTIDEFKFYNYALTSDEILVEYNHGAALQLGSNSTPYCIPGDTATCTAPVAEWNFEEGSGTSVADSSGNSNTGTWSGTGNHWVPGKIGKAGGFNGGNDYVSKSSYSLATPYTMELWFNPTQWTHGGRFAGFSGGANGLMTVDSGGKKLSFDNCHLSLTPVGLNVWQHITYVNDGTNINLYYNGNFINSCGSGAVGAISSIYLGRTPDGLYTGWPFKIDQFRIFNYARTATQVAWDYNRGGPVGWWKMNECSGTAIKDSASATNSGVLTGGTPGTCDTSGAWNLGKSGKYGYSLNFDGTNYVNFTTPINYVSSVSFWAKPTAVPQNILQLNSTVNLPSNWSGATLYVNGILNGTVTANSWNHIVLINTAGTSANAIKFGLVGATYYTGQLDDVRIFNYALTATQVKTLFNENSAVRFGQ